MKLTPIRREKIQRELERMALKCDLRYTPRLSFNGEEIRRITSHVAYNGYTNAISHLGVAWHKRGLIYLNLRRHKTLEEIYKTLAHEVCHLKWRYNHHEPRFLAHMKNLIKK